MSDPWDEFDLAVSRWRLGQVMAERLPTVAVEVLSAGRDTPSLGQLAAMDGSGWSEIEPVVASVLGERGRDLPTEREAVKWVADDAVQRIATGALAPEVGTGQLGRLWWKFGELPDLRAFFDLMGDWDSAQGRGAEHREVVRAQIVAAAQAVSERGGVRLT